MQGDEKFLLTLFIIALIMLFAGVSIMLAVMVHVMRMI